jgi:hypothetical protein
MKTKISTIILGLLLGLSSNIQAQEAPTSRLIKYTTTRQESILQRVITELKLANKDTLVIVVTPYITAKNVANTLAEIRQKGTNVIFVGTKNPPINNYSGYEYLTKNKIAVFTEDVPQPKQNVPKSTESYILVGGTNTAMFLSIPLDNQYEIGAGSLLIIKQNPDLMQTMLRDFGERVKQAQEFDNSEKNLIVPTLEE